MMKRWVPITCVLVGAAGIVALAAKYEMTSADSIRLAVVAGGAALLAGGAGAVALRMLRGRSLALQLIVVTLTAVVAVAAGAVTAANEMFLSDHDLHTLFVVLIASGTVGVVVSFLLGERIAHSSKELEVAAEQIAEGGIFTSAGAPAKELAELGERLGEMSVRLEEARARERALDSSRRELVAWVSHDLRTPLAGIRAMVEALEDGVVTDPATVARYQGQVRLEVDRLSGLVDDLFELSRINSGGLMLEMEKASLEDLVSDALSSAGPAARLKGVNLEGNLKSEAAELSLSVSEMGRALRNLLENAIRHTPADGTVTLEAGIEGTGAFVSILDSCGGIPADDIDRVFEVAFRGASARTADDAGGGLGLAIARGIVEAHDGSIEVMNEGRGCRFTVMLPLPRP